MTVLTFVYVSETWTLTKKQEAISETAVMNFLRSAAAKMDRLNKKF
jgi:hypothetical protein